MQRVASPMRPSECVLERCAPGIYLQRSRKGDRLLIFYLAQKDPWYGAPFSKRSVSDSPTRLYLGPRKILSPQLAEPPGWTNKCPFFLRLRNLLRLKKSPRQLFRNHVDIVESGEMSTATYPWFNVSSSGSETNLDFFFLRLCDVSS